MISHRDITDPKKNKTSVADNPSSDAVRAGSSVRSSDSDVAAFLGKLNELGALKPPGTGQGRLIFAMDATMSRQPTWDMALSLQADMFDAVSATGGANNGPTSGPNNGPTSGLDVQLVYFRGFGECRNSKWVSDASSLTRLMTSVSCRGGRTQIRKVFLHGERETDRKRVNALVYVGDAMEENVDELAELAGRLGLKGVPLFLFQEGYNTTTETAFREFARLSRGAYCRFDAGAADQLRELLSAVAVYASGGRAALENHSGGKSAGARLLLEQLK